MAYEESLRSISLNADSSLAGYTGVPNQPDSADPNFGKAQYRFVKVTGERQVGLVTAKTDTVIGVAQNKPQVNGQAVTVAIRGVTNVLAGAAIAAGDLVTTDATGRAIKASAGDVALGVVLTAASAANHVSAILLRVN